MALIRCPECGGEISDKAIACPHCGFPLENKNTEIEKPSEIEKSSNPVTKVDQSWDLVALISLRGGETFAGPIVWLTLFTVIYAVMWLTMGRLEYSWIPLLIFGLFYTIVAALAISRIVWVSQFNARAGKVIYYDRANKTVCFEESKNGKTTIPLDDIVGFYGPKILRIKYKPKGKKGVYDMALGFTTTEDVNLLNELKARSL